MSFTWNSVIRQAAIRLNALLGGDSATLNTAYLVTPLTTTQVDSADFPLDPFRDAAIITEGKLAAAIGNAVKVNGDGHIVAHPFRVFLAGVTSNLANGAAMPSIDSGSNPIAGKFGAVRDASDSILLTMQTLDKVRRIKAETWRVLPIYHYAYDGNRIIHTRINVVADCVVYDKVDRATSAATLTNASVLPDVLEEAMVCGVVSMMMRDDAFLPQAAVYRTYFNDTLKELQP